MIAGHENQMTSNIMLDGINKNSQIEHKSILIFIEPCLLTRQCISFWLEHQDHDIDLKAFNSAITSIEATDQDETVDLVIWSIGSRSITSMPCRQELQDLKAHFPATPLVLFADHDDPTDVAEAMRAGARGYIPTTCDQVEVWEILRFVRAGGTYVPASVLVDVERHNMVSLPRPCSKAPRSKILQDLTPREMDVVERLRQGKPNKIIAHELQISESTVKVFVHRILTKLGAINRTEVAYRFQD